MEPTSLVVEYDESPAETATLKIDNGFGKEHGIISIEEIINYKLDIHSLAIEMCNSDELRDASGSNGSMGTEESICQINKDVACDLSLQCSTTSSLVDLSEKGTDDYTDKTVMEVEFPCGSSLHASIASSSATNVESCRDADGKGKGSNFLLLGSLLSLMQGV